MQWLVDQRGTIAVNNACDLCNKRLLHAQPAPRNSMLRNRSASETSSAHVCAQLRDIRCSVHRRCYVHLRLSLRASRGPIRIEAHRHFRWCRLTIRRLQSRTDITVVNIACACTNRDNDGTCTELLPEVLRYAREINKFKISLHGSLFECTEMR